MGFRTKPVLPTLILKDTIDFTLLEGYTPEQHGSEVLPWYFGSLSYESFQCTGGKQDIWSSSDNREYLLHHSDARILFGNSNLIEYIDKIADIASTFLRPLLKSLKECFVNTDEQILTNEQVETKLVLLVKEYMGGYHTEFAEDGIPLLLGSEQQASLLD